VVVVGKGADRGSGRSVGGMEFTRGVSSNARRRRGDGVDGDSGGN